MLFYWQCHQPWLAVHTSTCSNYTHCVHIVQEDKWVLVTASETVTMSVGISCGRTTVSRKNRADISGKQKNGKWPTCEKSHISRCQSLHYTTQLGFMWWSIHERCTGRKEWLHFTGNASTPPDALLLTQHSIPWAQSPLLWREALTQPIITVQACYIWGVSPLRNCAIAQLLGHSFNTSERVIWPNM